MLWARKNCGKYTLLVVGMYEPDPVVAAVVGLIDNETEQLLAETTLEALHWRALLRQAEDWGRSQWVLRNTTAQPAAASVN